MFTSKKTERYTHPTEPDVWVEMRLPPSPGTLRGIDPANGDLAAGLDILANVITAWSDPRPVTKEAVDELDTDSFKWLTGIVREAMGDRSDEEKKDSHAS